MKNQQIAKNNMYKKTSVFFANAANSNVWNGFPRLVTEIGNFAGLNATFSNYIQQQQLDTTGVTQGKTTAYNNMLLLVVNKAHKAYVWAVDAGNAELSHAFDVQKSDFHDTAESTAFSRIKNIRDAISANISSMASVQLTAADVTAINTSITAYQNTIGTPAAAIKHKAQGTQAIEDLMHPIDNSLHLIDRLLVSSYSSNHADMVKEYLLNRQIDDLPTHHNGAHAHITDAATGADLPGAVLSILDETGKTLKTATSDINGIAEIIKIKAGTYTATIMLNGYQTLTNIITIKRGKVVSMEVGLKK